MSAGCSTVDPEAEMREAHARATVTARSRSVAAVVETVPVRGDADDPSIWVHPEDPTLSLVIGTDKDNGLVTWDLAGRMRQLIPSGEPNNVDVRYAFPWGDDAVDIVAADNRVDHHIDVYRIDPVTRELHPISGDGIPSDLSEVYGLCMYRSPITGKHYAFVNDKDGDVEQWELVASDGVVSGRLARTFDVGARTEGCVADDETATFYVSAERLAIWAYDAEPDSTAPPRLVDVSKLTDLAGGHLIPEVEGLAIYYGPKGRGYLIASSQGSDDFVIYDRRPPNDFAGRFRIFADGGSDAVTHADGIDVTNVALGPRFAHGLFVAHDTANDPPKNNFKLVPWDAIARAVDPPLLVDPHSYHPRAAPRYTAPRRSVGGRHAPARDVRLS